jgi:excinuclease ABC subunit C
MLPKKLSSAKARLRSIVANIPAQPGVYRWLDAQGELLYVGKAKNLRERVKQYFPSTKERARLGPWKEALIEKIAGIEFTVVRTELEALLLETNLIKELRPKYNVLMKDGKNYVYVRIALKDTCPAVAVTRRIEDDGATYVGPFLKAYELEHLLDLLHMIIGFRACAESIKRCNQGRTVNHGCLDAQIGRCCGLCTGVVTTEEYRSRVEHVLRFLRGDRKEVIHRAEDLMRGAAVAKKFERAAELRNALRALAALEERQVVSGTGGENTDVFGIARSGDRAHIVVLHERGGKIVEEEHVQLSRCPDSDAELFEQFLPQYYQAQTEFPRCLVLSETPPGNDALLEWLRSRAGHAVALRVPERGKKSTLLLLAERNALEKAKQLEAAWEADARNAAAALKELQTALDLPAPPARIEGYDISHLGGTETAGSMTVLVHGKPDPKQYRSFALRTIKPGDIDDYRSLREVLHRRLKYLVREDKYWQKQGIRIGKCTKSDLRFLEAHVYRSLSVAVGPLEPKQFLIASRGKTIVGFVRLRPRGKSAEVSSLWVQEDLRASRLAQVLVRRILVPLKKGKVYVRTHPEQESFYAELGFRHAVEWPSALPPESLGFIAMLYDVVSHKADASLNAVPDLLLIDGGKGQLQVAVDVLHALQLSIPVCSLAKRAEEVFMPRSRDPVPFPPDSPARFLLMRLRDEAHRFSNKLREQRGWKAMVGE